ncbi:MAG: narK [Dehalococcoidia bacterium]|nr:narK [Dehalococcoidia bacterium]
MNSQNSPPTGHLPTLIASFLHFDLSFMLWVLLGALGVYIGESMGLNPAEKGLMVAVPALSGSLLRVPIGLLSDYAGGKLVGVALLAFLFVPLTLGWRAAEGLSDLLYIGLMLGAAGASFAVTLPLACSWYPLSRQGLVMGIVAAGNSGAVVANLLAPPLAALVGWNNVLGLAMLPLSLVLVAFLLMAQDSPVRTRGEPLARYLMALQHRDLWWLCIFYSVTFGGFAGLSSFLPTLLRDQYRVNPATAGYLTALAAFAGSAARPLGGYLADRLGGVRMLSWLLFGIGAVYTVGSRLPELGIMVVLLVSGMVCLGMGNGAVFQLVPQRFSNQIGITTGVVGAVGGLGGFLLPVVLGLSKQVYDSFSPGFVLLALLALGAFALLRVLVATQETWRWSWRVPHTDGVREDIQI